MYRINLLGKVGYFKEMEEVYKFALGQFNKNKFDCVLKDLRGSIEITKKDFLSIKAYNTKRLIGRNKMVYKNNIGVKVCNYFTNYRFKLKAMTKRSVEKNIKDKKKLKNIVNKIITLHRNKNISLRDFFVVGSITGGGQGLGNFMPVVAKAIYEEYCPVNKAKILDISAGFGGRLTGAVSSKYDYFYTGVDPSTKAVESANQLIEFLNVKDRARVIHLPFEDTGSVLEDDYYDLCFTSPPYFKKEIYSEEATQSCNRYSDIEGWRIGFLKKSFDIVYRKLKEGKYMLINIADVRIKSNIYPLEQITIDTGLEAGFKYKGYKLMLMGRIPGSKRKYKTEKIFVFKKGVV